MQMSEKLFDCFMKPLENWAIDRYRRELIPEASGKILEIGGGTGSNLPYYNKEKIETLILTDISVADTLRKKTEFHGWSAPILADVQQLPFEANSIDTVVFTLVFCSVPDPEKGLLEIRRVLKPGGKLLFIEHVAACHNGMKKIQQILTPAWKRIASNCHLDRETLPLIQHGGFSIISILQSKWGLLVAGIGENDK